MKAMVLTRSGAGALELAACERDVPIALPGEVLVRVRACGVCQTDLHVVDGDLPQPELPLVPGHEIVGVVERLGDGVTHLAEGDRVGIAWMGYTCDACTYCKSGRENLCASARFTGYQIDGGYAEYTVVDARFAFKIPEGYGDAEAAPLLCAGLIGYRAYRLIGDARRLGVYGCGAAAQILTQVAVAQGRDVYVFTPPGDAPWQQVATGFGAAWAGASSEPPPEPLDAAIICAAGGTLIPEALSRTSAGGTVVCAGFHVGDVPAFAYRHLSDERVVRSATNFTRHDAREFLAAAPKAGVKVDVRSYDLEQANRALADLRQGEVRGAAVLLPAEAR